MNYTINKKANTNVVSLEEAKRQLSRFDSEDDLHIDMVIESAIDMAEAYTHRFFSRTELVVSTSREGSFLLPMSDNINVLSVKGGDGNDVEYTISDGVITIKEPVVITYETGLNSVGPRVKMACLRIVSDLYQHREDDVFGASKSMVSTSAYDILDSIKRPMT